LKRKSISQHQANNIDKLNWPTDQPLATITTNQSINQHILQTTVYRQHTRTHTHARLDTMY